MQRIFYFVICGLIVLGVYTIIGLFFFQFMRGLWMNADETSTGGIKFYFWYIIYSAAYILPLYFLCFLRNSEYKRQILHLTEGGFDLKEVLKQFTLQTGKYDLMVYAGYSLVMLLFYSDKPTNPVIFLFVQQYLFYALPIPRVVGFLLAVLLFVVQYYICLVIAARHWNKHRLHLGQ